MDSSIRIWMGEWGVYRVPQEVLAGTRLRKDGWPDGRSPARNTALMQWVAAQEAKERERMLLNDD